MKANLTNVTVTVLGTVVSGLGYGLIQKDNKSKLAPGLLGFGLAHIALGVLDMSRNYHNNDAELPFDIE